MAFKTAQQLITQIERAIYQSAGSAVQIYSQDLLLDMVQQAFTHLFDLHFWPRFMVRETLTLDGVTGQTTAVPTQITDYKDIKVVYPGTYNKPMRILPYTISTERISSGGTPQYLQATSDTKLIKVWPLNATGTIQLVGRARPAQFVITDAVPFDDLLIVHFAAWSYFTDDGSSPNSAAKHQGLFENRLKAIENSEYNHPIQLNTNSWDIPDRWSEWG
jgi:hypothetical protein